MYLICTHILCIIEPIEEGIHFAKIAFDIENNSAFSDTLGEGYFNLKNMRWHFPATVKQLI